MKECLFTESGGRTFLVHEDRDQGHVPAKLETGGDELGRHVCRSRDEGSVVHDD